MKISYTTVVVIGVIILLTGAVGSYLIPIQRPEPTPIMLAPTATPQPTNPAHAPSLLQPVTNFLSNSPTPSPVPASLHAVACQPADQVQGPNLPILSPSGFWCQLKDYPGCEAAWCHGYWADYPSVAQASVIYDCNQPGVDSRGICEIISPEELPPPQP